MHDCTPLYALQHFCLLLDLQCLPTVSYLHGNGLASTAALDHINKLRIDLAVKTLQDKFLQKQHFRQAQIPLGNFLEVSNAQQAEQAGREFGYPLMLKSRRFAYDGKGNAVVQSPEGLENAVQQLGGYKHGLYAEKWTAFVKVSPQHSVVD